MRWAELLDENMPQELHRNIEEQKAACAEIIASKVERPAMSKRAPKHVALKAWTRKGETQKQV